MIDHTQRRSHTVLQYTTQHCNQSLLFFTHTACHYSAQTIPSLNSGFACACESTDLFKALKIVHKSFSTKIILRMLKRQQLQVYLALYLAEKYILGSTVCVDNQHTPVKGNKNSVASHTHSLKLVNIAVYFASSPVQSPLK